MARMTKTQINYLEDKLFAKLNSLVRDKRRLLKSKLETELDIGLAISKGSFIKWLKRQTKKHICDAIDKEGRIRIHDLSYRARGNVELAILELTNSKNPLIQRFLQHTNAVARYAKIAEADKKASEYRDELNLKKTEVIDAAVFAETPVDVQKAIASFMALK